MRRRLIAAAVALPISLCLLAPGCGSGEPKIENLCGWLGDPENCFSKFAEDVGATCGRSGLGSGPKGSFLARDALDVCILSEGGQVLFDPPLDLAQFPVQSSSFKFVKSDGNPCGAASFTGSFIVSLTVEPPADGGTSTAEGGEDGVLQGGTFAVVGPEEPGRETFDTTCPSGEAHHFDRLSVSECRELEPLLPRVEFESNVGGVLLNGYVRFRMFFPPDGGLVGGPSTIVEYFDCAIPAAPPSCVNGVQDGSETDVDCGGQAPSGGTPICETARCADGQKCIEASDCESMMCEFEMGLKKCAPLPR